MQSGDEMYGYTTMLLASGPIASQLSMAQIKWTIFFPIFAIPAITLLISIGHLSRAAPVQTFRKMAPIGAGIGWALTWHIAEKLYTESLRASQIFIYFLNSFRPSMAWATECNHSFNSAYCNNFNDPNISILNSTSYYPNNFWPAQEFNRFKVRQNPHPTKMPAHWEPNMWYLGDSKEEFYFDFPSIPLLLSHFVTWSIIYTILVKYYDRLGDILTKVFVFGSIMLYLAVGMGMTISGLHFTNSSLEVSLDDKKISEDPFDFWADLKGGFRTSILIVDYSMAFTGIILFATSRLRSGVGHLSALFIVPNMMIVPVIQTILRAGCEGHVSDLQPNYKIFASTDETISFDLFPVCFATSNLGPLWSVLYFLAQYLYTSLGPMIVYTAFIYQSFIDDIPTVQNIPKRFIGLLCLVFTIPAIFLYMPLGTKVAALFRYTSQSAIIQILAFIVIFFVYGWQRIEQDVLMTSPTAVSPSLADYLIRPTSPIYTTALFTIIPMMLCAKFVAVFDFLPSGNDVMKHIDAGVQFIPLPHWAARLVGYIIMFAPLLIVLVTAAYTTFDMSFRHKLPLSDLFRPTSDWMSHASVNMSKPRPHSLAYGIFNTFSFAKYSTILTVLLIFETFLGIILVVLFFLNSLAMIGLNSTQIANDYRSCMLLVFVILHIFAMFQMRQSQQTTSADPTKISIYIGIATMEMSMLNGYLWMFSSDHSWGLDTIPILLIISNLWIRGCCILAAIAVRAHMIEQQRPSRARDASEIYEPDMTDADDDSPVIFDLAHA